MSDQPDLDAARLDADRARERMIGTAHELQARLKPTNLAEHAIEGIRARGETAANEAVALVRRQPVAAAAAALGLVALLARKPIAGLVGRLRGPSSPKPKRRTGDRR